MAFFGESDAGVLMTRQAAVMEVLVGCEAKNTYNGNNTKKPTHEVDENKAWYMWEDSKFLERILCNQNRSLTLTMAQGGAPQNTQQRDAKQKLFTFHKPFSCVQACCLKTSMTMKDPNNDAVVAKAWVKTPVACNCCGYSGVAGNGQDDTVNFKLGHKYMWNARGCCPCLADLNIPVLNGNGDPVATIGAPKLSISQCLFQQNVMDIKFDDSVKLSSDEKNQIMALMVLVEIEYFWNQDN